MLAIRVSCLVRNRSLFAAQHVTVSRRRYTQTPLHQDLTPLHQDLVPLHQDLASLGLGGYSPVGLLQTALDYTHLHTGLPWWATIAMVTVALRLMMLPLSIKMFTYGTNLVNVKEGAASITTNIGQLRKEGRNKEADDECVRLVDYFADNKASPLKIMTMPFLQVHT